MCSSSISLTDPAISLLDSSKNWLSLVWNDGGSLFCMKWSWILTVNTSYESIWWWWLPVVWVRWALPSFMLCTFHSYHISYCSWIKGVWEYGGGGYRNMCKTCCPVFQLTNFLLQWRSITKSNLCELKSSFCRLMCPSNEFNFESSNCPLTN